jgi:hypothetical protein
MGDLSIDAAHVGTLTSGLRSAAAHVEPDASLGAVDDEEFASPVADELRASARQLERQADAVHALIAGLATAADRAAGELRATDAALATGAGPRR